MSRIEGRGVDCGNGGKRRRIRTLILKKCDILGREELWSQGHIDTTLFCLEDILKKYTIWYKIEIYQCYTCGVGRNTNNRKHVNRKGREVLKIEFQRSFSLENKRRGLMNEIDYCINIFPPKMIWKRCLKT